MDRRDALGHKGMSRRDFLRFGGASLAGAALLGTAGCGSGAGGGGETGGGGGEVRKFKLGYDQPSDTAYGITADMFQKKLEELSGGSMSINQFPGAQLGEEPEMLQKVTSGDIDFIIAATANVATVAPQAGVFSLHYLFADKEHYITSLADSQVSTTFKEMIRDSVDGARVLTLHTLGFRDMYSKTEIRSVDDVKGKKVRVQATKTEDRIFREYGAQTTHMAFGEVYTSLQTGVVDIAENGIKVYQVNKHYEVAPILSFTEHEANTATVWVSDKVWNNLSEEEKGWVQEAADDVGKNQPAQAFELEDKATEELKELGVKVVDDVDKSSFASIAEPLQVEIAKNLGPYAEKIVEQVKGLR